MSKDEAPGAHWHNPDTPAGVPLWGPRFAGTPRPIRALIVEDQPHNLLVLESLLKKLGCHTETCADGHAALARMQEEPFDLVLMDWDLPGLDGTEITRRYRTTEPPGRHTLIIAITAYSAPEKIQACLAAGMDGFAAKPLGLGRLRDTIQNLVGARRDGSPLPVHGDDAPPPGQPPGLATFHFMADGNPRRVAELARDFLIGLAGAAASLNDAIAAGDSEATRRQAHIILSQTALVSASRLAALAARIQEAARAGDIVKSREIWPGFACELESFSVSLRTRTAWFEPS